MRERLPLALGIVATALLVSVALAALSSRIPDREELVLVCLFSLVSELWIATGAFLGALFLRAPPIATLGLAPGRLSARELSLLVLGTLAASHALDGALELTGQAEGSALSELPRMLHGASGLGVVAAVLGLAVAPAIAEELLCRGLIQRSLARRFGPAVAIPVAAAVFGALHIDPVYALFATLLGLYLGAAAWWADSTRAAILCHGVNNLCAVGLGVLTSEAWASPASTIVSAALAFACLWIVGRRRRDSRGASNPGAATPSAKRPV